MNATLKPISLDVRKPTPADADAAEDVLWLERIDSGSGVVWVAWSGPFYNHKGHDPNDKCSGIANHWLPLTVFSTEA
jgi:hypothetical protein